MIKGIGIDAVELPRMKELIEKKTDLNINVCENASNTVVSGLGRIIEDPKLSSLALTLKQANFS